MRLGVLAHVRQGLLDDAEDLGLRLRREGRRPGIRRRLDHDRELRGVGEPTGVLLDGSDEAGTRLDRAAESQDRLAHVDVDGSRGAGELRELDPGLVDPAGGEVLVDSLRLGVDVAEDLGQAVVHLAGDPLALVDDGKLPEARLEVRVLDRDRRLVGERGEGLHVVDAEGSRRRGCRSRAARWSRRRAGAAQQAGPRPRPGRRSGARRPLRRRPQAGSRGRARSPPGGRGARPVPRGGARRRPRRAARGRCRRPPPGSRRAPRAR